MVVRRLRGQALGDAMEAAVGREVVADARQLIRLHGRAAEAGLGHDRVLFVHHSNFGPFCLLQQKQILSIMTCLMVHDALFSRVNFEGGCRNTHIRPILLPTTRLLLTHLALLHHRVGKLAVIAITCNRLFSRLFHFCLLSFYSQF